MKETEIFKNPLMNLILQKPLLVKSYWQWQKLYSGIYFVTRQWVPVGEPVKRTDFKDVFAHR